VKKGNVLGKLGLHHEAIQCFDSAIEIQPDYADEWKHKGNANNQLLRPYEANACWDRAKQLGAPF
jgi:tetratricopeptide (TPR) repeat protein